MKHVFIMLVVLSMVGGIVFLVNKQPVSAPEPLNNDIMDTDMPLSILTESVIYFENATGHFARPEAVGSYPGIIMIHENRGLRPEIKDAAETLASKGYLVLAVDLYQGTVMETQEEARAYSAQFDQTTGVSNMRAAATFLRNAGAPKIASLGWCFGGAQSLALATAGESLDATVIYYGRLTEDEAALAALNAPLLGIFGDQDQVVSTTSVATFEANLQARNVPAEIHMYEGVGHAFANPSNPNFAELETADAWQKTLNFLERNLRR